MFPVLGGVSQALPFVNNTLDTLLDDFLTGLKNGNVVDALFNLITEAAGNLTTYLQASFADALIQLLSRGK